jgi:hypothetical protein
VEICERVVCISCQIEEYGLLNCTYTGVRSHFRKKDMKLKVFILFNLICFTAFSQKMHSVKVLPGQGIVYDNDSILLFKTTIKQVCSIFKIKYEPNPNEYTINNWDGFEAETGKRTSGSEYSHEIKFKSINFEFTDENDRNNLKLKWITIQKDKSLRVFTESGLEIGMINPKIIDLYPKGEKNDYISDNKLTYNLYTYGISMQLVQLPNNDLKLTEISTHYKLK